MPMSTAVAAAPYGVKFVAKFCSMFESSLNDSARLTFNDSAILFNSQVAP